MRMRYSPMSPFVRKARVTAHEVGVADRIELVPTDMWDSKTGLDSDNPLEKIPALILDDGRVLFDSPFICEYLDHEFGSGALFPPPGPARWAAFRLQALGDGIADAAVLWMDETRRPANQQSDFWKARLQGKIARAADALEAEAASLDGPVTIGQISVACALGFLDFRKVQEGWREGRPKLAAWHTAFSRRPSMQATTPHLFDKG